MRLTVANVLGTSRLMSPLPILLLLAGHHNRYAFALYLTALATDALDGPAARWQKTASTNGALLDGIADNALALGVPAFVAMDDPATFRAVGGLLLASAALQVLYVVLVFLLTRRVLLFHFLSAKIGAVLYFLVWPAVHFHTLPTAAAVAALACISFSRAEQLWYALRGGRSLDAPHGFVGTIS